MIDPFSIPGFGSALRWLAAKVFGVTDEPNLRLSELRTVETVDDPRRAWHHWAHMQCVNEQRTGRSRWLRTKTATGCHAKVEFKRTSEGQQITWSDNVPFTTGGPDLIQTADLVAGDGRFFVPLFLDLPSPVPDPRGNRGTIGPGLFPTGNQFLGGLSKALPIGSYAVTVHILQGDAVLARRTFEAVSVEGEPSPL